MRLILSLLCFVVLAIGLACQKVETQTTNTNLQKVISNPADNSPRISLDDAKKDFDAGTAVFIDTRAEVQFRQEHIKGAINIPAEAIDTRYSEIPKDKKVIAYCS